MATGTKNEENVLHHLVAWRRDVGILIFSDPSEIICLIYSGLDARCGKIYLWIYLFKQRRGVA